MREFTVYVRVDDEGRVVDIGSDAFLRDTQGWVEIDKGRGDRYHHAQNHYLDGGLTDERGVYRYAMVEGQVQARTQAEMDGDFADMVKEDAPTPDARLAALEETLAAYEDMLLMM